MLQAVVLLSSSLASHTCTVVTQMNILNFLLQMSNELNDEGCDTTDDAMKNRSW